MYNNDEAFDMPTGKAMSWTPEQRELLDRRAARHRMGKDLWNSIREEIEDGVDCPCCGRLVKLYKRRLHTEMAIFLIKLYKVDKMRPGEFFMVRDLIPSITKSVTDGSYLVHWGMVETLRSNNEVGGKAGLYRITERGKLFVECQTSEPSHIHMLCGDCIGMSEEKITIVDALHGRFDYDELMKGGKE
jgi:hypothetical protein